MAIRTRIPLEDIQYLKFSQALEEYLDLRAEGPDEACGYTDKAYYIGLEKLKLRMDQLTGGDRA